MKKNEYFKGLDYYSRRDAKVALCHFLMKQEGWQVVGYHADASDSMTDYYNPASWGGVATFGEYTLVVDCKSAADANPIYKERVGQYPGYLGNPAHKGWHLEKDGQIVTSGQSVAKMYHGYWDGGHSEEIEAVQQACQEFLADLRQAMEGKPKSLRDFVREAKGQRR